MKGFRHIALLTVLLVVACQQEPEICSPSGNDGTARVCLDLSISPSAAGTPETRAVNDPELPEDVQIKNLCILQYAGTDAEAPLVGDVMYIYEGMNGSSGLDLDHIPLADSRGALHTLVILANTFGKIQPALTLGEMKNFYRNIYSADDVPGHEGSVTAFPDGADYYLRFHGIAVTEIAEGKSISAILHRSHARIRIHLSNTGADGLTIQSVQLRNVAKKDYYLTDYSYPDPEDGSIRLLFDEPFHDDYNHLKSERTDFDALAWTGNPDGTGEADYLWYVPSNMRGVDSVTGASYLKNRSDRTAGATFLEVTGAYGASQEHAVVYRFYLGANLVNDFNLCPNTAYTYMLAFDGKGQPETDSRINEFAPVDFEYDANCYILNPPPSGSCTYSFNVVHRINTFWGARYGLNDVYPNYTIDATKQWKAFVMWGYREDGGYLTSTEVLSLLDKKEGSGAGTYMSDAQRIRITVPSDIRRGNYMVGVYIDDPSNILWSWHLWITDYQPDDISGTEPIAGQYVYVVNGGEVHRYAGASWGAGGRYKHGYAMDRDLGTLDDHSHNESQEFAAPFVYQFGRKDPFVAYKPGFYQFDPDGNRISSSTSISYSSATLSVTGGANVPYSVNHPMVFISGNNAWTNNDVFNPATYNAAIVWQDPQCMSVTAYEEVGKSIFDPCPPGWRVPVFRGGASSNCYAGFSSSGSSSNTLGVSNDRKGRGSGLLYYPLGVAAGTASDQVPTAFFPSWYGRSTSGSGSYYGTSHWTTSPNSLTYANVSNFSNGNSGFTYPRACAFPVRCVKE